MVELPGIREVWEILRRVGHSIRWPASDRGELWTRAVDRWFRKAALFGNLPKRISRAIAPDEDVRLRVYSKPSGTGEYLWDHTWCLEDRSRTERGAIYPGCVLAMECEWAWKPSPEERMEMILYDYWKLLDCPAPYRAMVFNSKCRPVNDESARYRESILEPLLEKARRHWATTRACQRGEASILLIDMEEDQHVHAFALEDQLERAVSLRALDWDRR